MSEENGTVSIEDAKQVLIFANQKNIETCSKEIQDILKKYGMTLKINQMIVIEPIR